MSATNFTWFILEYFVPYFHTFYESKHDRNECILEINA